MQRVLLVEDEPHQRAIYRAVFEHHGYQVFEAGDGESAVRIAEADRPDLILMDVGLPWMDGWEVTRRLKELPRTAFIPIVAISAHVGSEGETRAAAAGCAGFISKALDPQGVVAAVESLMGAPPG